MKHIDFTPCPAGLDACMRSSRKSDRFEYWKYMFVYTDDILVVSEHGEILLREHLFQYIQLKEESIGSL